MDGPGIWDRMAENLPMWVGSAVVSSIVGVILALVFRRLGVKGIKPTDVVNEPAPTHPRPSWHDAEIARTYLAANLLNGFTVAPGTRVLLIDGGVRQGIDLPEGAHHAADVARRFARHSIRPSAVVLQYSTRPVVFTLEYETQSPVPAVAALTVGVSVRPESAERIVKWDLLHDGVLSVAEVEAFVRDGLGPAVRTELSRSAETPGADRTQVAIRNAAEQWLAAQLEPVGLRAQVRALDCREPG